MASTAGDASWTLVAAMAAATVIWPAACTPGGTGVDPYADSDMSASSDVLVAIADHILAPSHEAARTSAESLVDALEAWEASADPAMGPERQAAQLAWRDAMAAWQRIEVMQVGPAGSSLTTRGGDDIRDEIYSWPTVNPCRVDQETIEATFDDPDYFDAELPTSYGFDALEYMLFAPSSDHDCPIQVPIDEGGVWTSLGDDGVWTARAAHSVAVALHVVDDIARLESAWSNGFRQAFTAPDGTVYSSEADALNAVFHAMFYLESQTKDVKLAHPLGILDCDADVCPEDLESLYASASIDHIAANLEGFRALFFGIDGSESFDDLLVAAGHEDLVAQVALRLDEADAVIAELDTALVDAISHDLDSALAVHTAVKAVTDLIKNEMSAALLLQVPTEVAGDND